ncbi:helix-turn-helix domain-containing protein (plasmid) [Nocardia sp. CA-084685]|uniref:helix-turn-helix domain-containing protein n=1 Tax=Nocardia sp. CA-084685 TaxID=3239970 RepID=UPI003D99797F
MSGARGFGAELRNRREQRRLPLKQLATLTNYAATHIAAIERGERHPPQDLAASLDAVLQADGALLALAVTEALQRRLDTAAHESTALARLAREEPVSGLSRDRLARELASIAQNYVHQPPIPLLNDLIRVRDRIQQSLQLGPRPERARDLYLLGAVAVQLLGEITDDLAGNSAAALQHVAAAQSLAKDAGHPGLEAWIAGTRALIVEWSPEPHHALEILEHATRLSPPGDHRIRLYALQARCAARVGDADLAHTAADNAVRAAEETAGVVDEVNAFGGALTFPLPKLSSYVGSAMRRIGDHRRAEQWALEAITGYATGPADQRSYGDEALARIDVGLARIAGGDIDGADDILTPVLELPPEQRICPIMEGMRTVTAALQIHPHADAPVAKNLAETITAYAARQSLVPR